MLLGFFVSDEVGDFLREGGRLNLKILFLFWNLFKGKELMKVIYLYLKIIFY